MPESLTARYPVDEVTYDLLVLLSSKLEALHLYERFAEEDSGHRELVRHLMEEDARHADLLLEALRDRVLPASPREHLTQPGGQGGPNDPTAPHGRSGLTAPGAGPAGGPEGEAGSAGQGATDVQRREGGHGRTA